MILCHSSESTLVQTVRKAFFQVLEGVVHYVVYCVVCVAAMPLPYETFDNTGKDIVLAHTHNTKELQVMKCNQSRLCSIRHTLVN